MLAVTLAVTLGLGMVGVTLAHMSRQTHRGHAAGMMGSGMEMMSGGQMGQMMQACTQMMQQMSTMIEQCGTPQPQAPLPEKK